MSTYTLYLAGGPSHYNANILQNDFLFQPSSSEKEPTKNKSGQKLLAAFLPIFLINRPVYY